MRFSAQDPRLVAVSLLALYAGVLLVFGLTRFYELKTSMFDIGSYNQIFWNYLQQGRWVATVPPPFFGEQHPFAHHFTPFFYFVLPVYWLFPHAETFVVLQGLLFAAAAWPVFLSARALGHSGHVSLLWMIIFIGNPFILNAAVWDFHETCFSTFFMAWAMWAIVRKNRTAMILFGLLLMTCKEHYGLAFAGMGLLWAWRTREYKLGAGMAVTGIALAWWIIFYLVPSYNQTGLHLMMHQDSNAMNRFGWLRDPLGNSGVMVALMLATIFYAVFLLTPVMGLALRLPLWLLPAGADLLVNISSESGFMRSVLSYHSAPIIPVLVIASAAALPELFKKQQRYTQRDVLTLATAVSVLFGIGLAPLPLPFARNIWEIGSPKLSYAQHDQKAINEIRALLKPDDIVSTQANIGTAFSARTKLHFFPVVKDRADVIILRLEFPFRHARMIFGNPLGGSAQGVFDAYRELMQSGHWQISYWNNPWLVLRKNAPNPLAVEADVEKAWQEFIAQYEAAPARSPM